MNRPENSHTPSDSSDEVNELLRLRNEPVRASPRRSSRLWKGSGRAMPAWEMCSRAASRRATSAPTGQTPICRSHGNSPRRLSSHQRGQPVPFLPFVEIIEGHLAQAASLEDHRRRIGDNAAELAQIAPSLRRVFPDIPQPIELPPAQKRRYLFQSVSEALARCAQTRSYLYILDDLQWADESSVALLIHLANRIAQLPVVIIGTFRDGYSDSNPALIRTLEELVRMGVRPQKLGGLPTVAVAQMLRELSQREAPESLLSLIYEESQGNPFFVEEVYRHLVEGGKVFDAAGQFRTDIKIEEFDVPENVRLVINRRLERLDENEKRVLAAAAVIGRSFSFQLLTAISQIDVDELFTIEKAQ